MKVDYMNYYRECGELVEIIGTDCFGFDIYGCESGCQDFYEQTIEFKKFEELFLNVKSE